MDSIYCTNNKQKTLINLEHVTFIEETLRGNVIVHFVDGSSKEFDETYGQVIERIYMV